MYLDLFITCILLIISCRSYVDVAARVRLAPLVHGEVAEGDGVRLYGQRVAVVASGTATLEASVIGVPMVVVYKLAWPDWIIGKLFVKVPYFALPNLILQKRAVCELLQTQVTPERLLKEVLSILDDSSKRSEILSYLLEVRKTLGEPGSMAKIASFVNSVLLGEI